MKIDNVFSEFILTSHCHKNEILLFKTDWFIVFNYIYNGSLKKFNAATFFKTKMNEILCRTPFTILLSIQSRFKSNLSKVNKFTFLLLLQVVFGLYTRCRFNPNLYWKITLRQAMKFYFFICLGLFSYTYHSQNVSCATFFSLFNILYYFI